MSTASVERHAAPADLEHKSAGMPTDIEHKAAAAAEGAPGVLAQSDDDPYEFSIIGSVTGVLDEVNDIIQPGAFTATLGKRTPKIIKDHDWAKRLGRALSIKELLPGDPALPKTTADGKPWPKEAGALIAKVRLFKETPEGKAARERWNEDGPASQFSIGYTVPPRGATRDKAGVRHIKTLDLYEISDVLWGAMPLAGLLPGALATKVLAGVREDESKAADVDEDQVLADLHAAAEGQIDWEAVDAATASLESKYLALSPDVKDTKPGDGDAENLRRWYVTGSGAAKIRWGTEGDLTRCHRIAAKHMTSDRAWGYCQMRHRDATGEWNPESGSGEGKGLPPVEPRSALLTAYDPAAEVKAPAAPAQAEQPDVETVESKAYPFLDGSYEERNAAIRAAVSEALMGDVVERDSDMVEATTAREWDYVEIVATFPDRVIARRTRWEHRGGSAAEETYEIGYEFDGDDVSLSEPEEVRLEVHASVQRAGSGDLAAALPDVPEAVFAGVDAVSVGVKGLVDLATETKAGRVLSSANEARLRQAVEHLVHVLRAAGVPISPHGSDAPGRDAAATVDTTAPAGMEPAAPVEGKGIVPPDVTAAGLLAFLDSVEDDDQ